MNARENLLEELLEIAKTASLAGASVLSERADEPLEITVKGEAGNLVTNIDLAAEQVVRELITDRRPQDAITGEELDDYVNSLAEVRWSIDPLDGTTNYTRGAPYFCTSVAALHVPTNHWLVGAVTAPALGRTYFASRGGGAWLTTSQGLRRLDGPLAGRSARLLGLGFSYSQDVRVTQYAEIPQLMASFSDVRSLGSAALGLCEVADGRLDAFVESDLFEFDWAAGALIAEESGVVVQRPTGMRGGVATFPFAT